MKQGCKPLSYIYKCIQTLAMEKEKLLGYMEIGGELLVVLAAAAWMPLRDVASWAFAAGVAIFAFGRFLQTPFYAKCSPTDVRELPLRRLHHQRLFGMVALILSAVLMHMPQGFHFGVYITAGSWIMMFSVFVVIEVYSTFRILHLLKS